MKDTNFESQRPDAVAEVQGLYGAFSFSERLMQKIWQRGDYDTTATRLADGRPLKVVHPGRWNHLGGPDFAGARLVIDGCEARGDVELHLHERDWAAHRHADDPAYDGVILHVVLFPSADTVTRGAGGRSIPILCLLPLLHHSLEEYAAEDAVEQLAGRPLHQAQELLGGLSNEELDTLLRARAEDRWRAKVRFARERIKRLGWAGACHHAALEILGYRFNRASMLTIATAFPLEQWARGEVEPERAYTEFADRWSLQGVRPLNHPRLRLKQYAAMCAARPEWPDVLRETPILRQLTDATPGDAPSAAWRRSAGLARRRDQLRNAVCADVVSGGRFDNLVGDGFLPLLAAETRLDLSVAWAHWFVGDAPEAAVRVLRSIGVFGGRERPVSQGPVQGLLGWMLAREANTGHKDTAHYGRGT